MTEKQEASIDRIDAEIRSLIDSLYADLGDSINKKAFGSVEGVAFQISELTRARGHVSAAAFRKE